MKNILTTFKAFLAIMIIVLLNACDDNSELFQISTPTPAVLSEVGITDIELDANNPSNPALTLYWEEADYQQQVSINYTIEFSSDDTFTNPVVASMITGNNTVTFTTSELNAAAGNAGLNPFNWGSLYARVTSSLGAQSQEKSISNTIQFRVYPYFNYVFKDYYLVGDAISSGWNNNNNNPALFRDTNNSNKFYYTGYYGNGHFKVLEVKGLWQPQWGTNDGTTIEVNPGGGSDPERFPTAGASAIAAGYYQFTIDFGAKTFDFQPYNEAGSTVYSGMSIQGDATPGGSTPTALNALSFGNHIWYLDNVHLVPGSLQFLTDTNTVWASDSPFSGISTENGASIPVVVEDDYDIWYNDLTGRYQLIPLNL